MFERPLTTLAALVVFAIALFVVSITPYGNTKSWIDAVSGSTKIEKQSVWREPSVSLKQSALRMWMENHGRNAEYRWTFLSSTSESVFGNTLEHGCGNAPPIHELRAALAIYVANASDKELTEFVDAMEGDSKSRQEAAVAKACEDALRALEANSGRSH